VVPSGRADGLRSTIATGAGHGIPESPKLRLTLLRSRGSG
jgi:hypothetical protein